MLTSPRFAKDVLAMHWNGSIPVPIDQLIRQLGIELVLDDNPPLRYYRSINRLNDRWRITNHVNRSSAQRWSLAHQLGHLILNHFNRDQLPHYETPASFRLTASSQREREANQFVGELLIPENVLNYAVVKHKQTTLQPLADQFGVSEVAMRSRLIELGITN